MDEENTESHWAAVAFMTTPEFLYFHSILIGLQVAFLYTSTILYIEHVYLYLFTTRL